MTKSEMLREAIRNEKWKEALKIAKGFHINVTAEERDKMSKAYECIVHPDFYKQIGTDIPKTIEEGKSVLLSL